MPETPGSAAAAGTTGSPRASLVVTHSDDTTDTRGEHAATPGTDLVSRAVSALAEPGLVVLTAVPGAGLTTALHRVATDFHGPVFTGGGLAILRTTPALPLIRAVRARLPLEDPALLAEAVRSRVRAGLLVVDDLQWADPLTLTALPAIARRCRVLAGLRTPHSLPTVAVDTLRASAAGWFCLPALDAEAAEALVRRTAPNLGPATVAAVVRRAGGIPLALECLARHAAGHGDPHPDAHAVDYAVAQALADLTRPARTAMAALGLLGRAAPRTLLGPGVDELLHVGLATESGGAVAARSPYVAEVAAGMLDAAERSALHRRISELVPAAEAARHLAAAGDTANAYRHAVAAATAAQTTGERADLLLLACRLDDVTPPYEVRLAAAQAALSAGRPRTCLGILGDAGDPPSTLLRAEALLQSGHPADANTAVTTVPDAAETHLVAARDRIRLLAALAGEHTDPDRLVTEITARHGPTPEHTGLRAALAAVTAYRRVPNWENHLATAASAAGAAGDHLSARWSAWILVETLAADGRLTEAARAAGQAAAACAADLAYSWQTRFRAAELWCTALRGQELDSVVRRAVDLLDRTVPAMARGYAVAAASLAEADSGLLAAARTRVTGHGIGPPPLAGLLDWVVGEAAWLDGQPDQATPVNPPHTPSELLRGLREITSRWAWYDGAPETTGHAVDLTLAPVHATLAAWRAVHTDPERAVDFAPAAESWHTVARREEIRCLLALGTHAPDPEQAVPSLLEAEKLAAESGHVVLLGRVRRALRRHAVRRETRGGRAGDNLTERERDVLRLVAQGEPTRRIAGLLGISRETVETHIRSGMRKLGARTRTEAAARAMETLR